MNRYIYISLRGTISMTQILVRIPEQLQKESKSLVKELGYTSVQEVIREALRDKILEHKKQKALFAIQELKGSAKNPKVASKSDLDKLAKAHYFS